MNEVIEQDSRYPEWMKAWNAKVAEIDQQIIDFFTGKSGRTDDDTRELNTRLGTWWDSQSLDASARSEYERARKEDADYFNRQVENRVRRLEDEGRFGWKQQGGSGNIR